MSAPRSRSGGSVSVRTRARPVDDPREQPLARAGLALDQHGRHPPGVLLPLEQPPELAAYCLDPRALTEQLGHRIHDRPHSTLTGQFSVQLLTTANLFRLDGSL